MSTSGAVSTRSFEITMRCYNATYKLDHDRISEYQISAIDSLIMKTQTVAPRTHTWPIYPVEVPLEQGLCPVLAYPCLTLEATQLKHFRGQKEMTLELSPA